MSTCQPSGAPPAHIVLLRPGALGDALLALPALAWLRRAWPGTRVTFVARADVLPLAAAAGLADATQSFDDPVWGALWAEGHATAKLRHALHDVDAVVAWLRDPDGAVACSLAAVGVARVVVAAGQPPDVATEHVALYLARTLAPLGLSDPPRSVAVLATMLPSVISAAGEREAESLRWIRGLADAQVVALHPGSGAAAKCWPAEHFAVMAGRLRQAGYTPVVIEGSADREPVARLLAVCSRASAMHVDQTWPPLVARNLSVEVLAGLLARCAGYLGNDSGVSHLAALAGCPALALFGPTDPARWAPVGRHVQVLRAPSSTMDEIASEAVWDELQKLMGMAPR